MLVRRFPAEGSMPVRTVTSQNQVRDIANNIAGTTLGGTYYRVVVKCREPVTNRETELEFAFRHGI